ncbi:hypothetical protein C8R45DRAFT_1212282 [Mycena sanguinolenta]|nr:hypothetical protein C8R45DRAFT_1212282 [Mycena sanguinolenta]
MHTVLAGLYALGSATLLHPPSRAPDIAHPPPGRDEADIEWTGSARDASSARNLAHVASTVESEEEGMVEGGWTHVSFDASPRCRPSDLSADAPPLRRDSKGDARLEPSLALLHLRELGADATRPLGATARRRTWISVSPRHRPLRTILSTVKAPHTL